MRNKLLVAGLVSALFSSSAVMAVEFNVGDKEHPADDSHIVKKHEHNVHRKSNFARCLKECTEHHHDHHAKGNHPDEAHRDAWIKECHKKCDKAHKNAHPGAATARQSAKGADGTFTGSPRYNNPKGH